MVCYFSPFSLSSNARKPGRALSLSDLPLYKLTYFLLLCSELVLVSNIFTFSFHHVLNCLLQTQWLTYQRTYELLHKLFGLKNERGKKSCDLTNFPSRKTSTPTLKQVRSEISHGGAGVFLHALKSTIFICSCATTNLTGHKPDDTSALLGPARWNCLCVTKNSKYWFEPSTLMFKDSELNIKVYFSVQCSFLSLVLLPAQRKVGYTKWNNFNANLLISVLDNFFWWCLHTILNGRVALKRKWWLSYPENKSGDNNPDSVGMVF